MIKYFLCKIFKKYKFIKKLFNTENKYNLIFILFAVLQRNE